MNVALLNVRIEILKNELVTDSIGNHTNKWNSFYSCYATVSGEQGSEEEAIGQTIDNSRIDFTIRYSSEIKSINSTNYKVKFNDTLYDIEAIDHNNFKKKCIKLSCRKKLN